VAIISPSDGVGRGALPVLVSFLGDLADMRVRHCAWKSNDHLLAALAGETDLDLLVDRGDRARFDAAVARHGLRRVVPPPADTHQAMEHYLGLDRASGRLFHLHVHFRLVLGERYVKNHRLPLERELLDNTRALHGVPVPAADLELAVLAVRALLKYRARDVVKDVLQIRSPGIPEETLAELEWLRGNRDLAAIRSGLDSIGAVVPADIVGSFLEVVTNDPRAGVHLLLLRSRLRRALRARRRHGRVQAGVTYAHALWRHRGLFGRRDVPGMTLPCGGTTVALVGADGSGKTTVAADVARWLGWKLETRVHYLGSKAPSPLTDWLYVGFRALRRSHRAASSRMGERSPAARPIAALRDLALALHHVSVGWDRRRHHARGRRDADAGGIAVFDRYPLASLCDRPEHRLLDGPQVADLVGPHSRGLTGALAVVEERIYRGFGLPDHLVLLDVDPLVAARRKPDHRIDVIRAKTLAAAQLAGLAEAAGAPVTRIDANQPLDRVLLEVKTRLWDAL
jgi:thymidylate kinase